jgi:dihydrofolate synthase/folylpolyglutamate synthase
LDFLFGLEKFGMKMDLQNIRSLMEFAGNPHRDLKVVHVAGTNGKGSTCAAIASVLTSMKYKVGLYTSPHIVSFGERIKIGGEQISEQEVERLTEFFRVEIVRLRATFFEATTAMMFKYFADNKVDYAVVETGLGGRLDSTNIVIPLVSVITGIGLDHTEILGKTLEKIASEKGGIIKPGKAAVINSPVESVKTVFRSIGAERKASVYFVDEIAHYENLRMDIHGSTFDANILGTEYPEIRFGLAGKHQVQNALAALTAIHILSQNEINIQKERVYDGFDRLADNTGLRGRLEIVSEDPLVLLDVAHNPDGIRALMASLELVPNNKAGVVLFAAMRDKDAKSMLTLLRQRFPKVILTELRIPRSLTVAELKKLSQDIRLKAQIFNKSSESLRAALTQINHDSFLLVTGSHYLAGEVAPFMDKEILNLQPQT